MKPSSEIPLAANDAKNKNAESESNSRRLHEKSDIKVKSLADNSLTHLNIKII
jgi:hypothetical protein